MKKLIIPFMGIFIIFMGLEEVKPTQAEQANRTVSSMPVVSESQPTNEGPVYEKLGEGMCEDLALLEYAINEAEKVGIDGLLYAALLIQESSCRVNAKSVAGAIGLGQVMPANANGCGLSVDDLYDPHKNIQCSLQILKGEYRTFGDTTRALQAYNAGPGRVKAGKLVRETREYPVRIRMFQNVLILQSFGNLVRVNSSYKKAGISDELLQLILNLHNQFPDLLITALNDEYHYKKGMEQSLHRKGMAVDFILNPENDLTQLQQFCVVNNCRLIDEFITPSKNATGGHFHIELK